MKVYYKWNVINTTSLGKCYLVHNFVICLQNVWRVVKCYVYLYITSQNKSLFILYDLGMYTRQSSHDIGPNSATSKENLNKLYLFDLGKLIAFQT